MKEDKINKLTSSIVSKIKEKRKLQGLSHESMAVELQISPSAYNKIERLETKLTVERLLQIQQILDVPLSAFLDLKTENTYNQEVKDNGIGHQGVENLYYENKAMAEKFIQNLQEEITFLRKIIEKK